MKKKLMTVDGKPEEKNDKNFARVGECAILFVKSRDAPDNAQFLVARIATAKGKVIWNHKDEKDHKENFAYLVEVEGWFCICLVSKRGGEVKRVISLDALQAKIELEEHSKRLEALARKKIKILLK